MEILGVSSLLQTQTGEVQQKKAEGFEAALKSAAESGNDEQIKSACESFESYFLSVMFKEMRKTINSQKTQAEIIFQEMLDDSLAEKAVSSGGIGLAAFMYKQMTNKS